jgi:chromate reductase
MRVLGIAGSLREASHNAALLRAAGELLPQGAEFVVWGRLREIPPYDEDSDDASPVAVADLKSAIASADAVIFATPEYNHSVPGQLKNAIDWVSRPVAKNPFRGKPVLVVGASTGLFGAVWAQAELRKVLASLGAEVLDSELPVGQAAEKFSADGALVDDDVREGLGGCVGALCDAVGAEERVAA